MTKRHLCKLPDGTFASFSEENCPGHVAWPNDRKVCGFCGVHIDELRPPEPADEDN